MPRITAPVRSKSARSQATKKALPAAPQELICSATWAPGLPGRSAMAPRPPSAANAVAMADPRPPAAPVMMTVVPVNRIPSPHRAPSDRRAGMHPRVRSSQLGEPGKRAEQGSLLGGAQLAEQLSLHFPDAGAGRGEECLSTRRQLHDACSPVGGVG